MSVSITVSLHNEVTSHLKKLFLFFINYWHKIPVSVIFSWIFFEIDLIISVELNMLLQEMQQYLYLLCNIYYV